MTYEKLKDILPEIMKEDGNSVNFKKFLEIYSKTCEFIDKKIQTNSQLLDLYVCTGHDLNSLGYMFCVERDSGGGTDITGPILLEIESNFENAGDTVAIKSLNIHESDEDFRTRILDTITKRKTAVSLVEMQQVLDSLVENGKIWVLPNYGNNPCNVYLTGSASELEIKRAYSIIEGMVGAGIGVVVPVYSFDTWQDIKDKFSTWQSLSQRGFIW